MTDISEFRKYTKEQIYEALVRLKVEYPAVYKHFFLAELERPFSPFTRQPVIFLTEEDTKKLGL